jgi:hypothetical protein
MEKTIVVYFYSYKSDQILITNNNTIFKINIK